MNSIEELFNKWKAKQSGENEYCWHDSGISKESFTKDGIVCEEIWDELKNNKKKRVLYLLREANGNSSKEINNAILVDDGRFWFQDCVNDEKNNLGKSIFKRIVEMQKVINEYENKPRAEVLKEVAYMNINKRGGHSYVDWKILNNYAKEYSAFIKREIELINPDVIVCCGTYWTLIDQICGKYEAEEWEEDKNYEYQNLEIRCEDKELKKLEIQHDEDLPIKVRVINMYHPSARISDGNYIKRFCEIYNETNTQKENGLSKDELIKMINSEKLKIESDEYSEICDLVKNINERLENKTLS